MTEQLLARLWSFISLLRDGFCTHRGFDRAATLTYTTLLSLVPLMTVILAILSAFPVAERMGEELQDFIFRNFVPASGEVIQQYLSEFAGNAARLTGASFLLLVVVAFLMMRDIDKSLNAIWETRLKRGTVSKFLTYWALLSLGPVLVAVSLAATSYLISLPLLVEAEETLGFRKNLIGLSPIAASAIAFALMYLVIPNRRVKFRDAVIGGLVAALLFEWAKRAFGYYVTNFPSYEAIYGTLAVIPIFLVWLYMSWVIFLFGAEFSHALERFRHQSVTQHSESEGMPVILALLAIFQSAHQKGEVLSVDDLCEKSHGGLNAQTVEGMLMKLSDVGIITQTDKENWVILQDLHEITLYDLLLKLHLPLPESDELILPEAGGGDTSLTQRLSEAHDKLRHVLGVPLDELLSNNAR